MSHEVVQRGLTLVLGAALVVARGAGAQAAATAPPAPTGAASASAPEGDPAPAEGLPPAPAPSAVSPAASTEAPASPPVAATTQEPQPSPPPIQPVLMAPRRDERPPPDEAKAKAADAPRPRAAGTAFGLELVGGFEAGAHFPDSSLPRSVDESVDSTLSFGAWVGTRTAVFGIGLEHAGLGKDHYGASATGETANTTYSVDTLWLSGRWYFWEQRPAFYLSGALGPASPTVRTTGTRLSGGTGPFVQVPSAYECTDRGPIGAGLAASAGVEFDVADQWSFLGEARASGHLLGRSRGAFDGCAPGSGGAVGGALRVGFAYRFGP